MRRSRRKPGRPPSKDGHDVRDGLLEAASSLFARQGYASTSLRDIAHAAGVTQAMVSYYFGSKEGLYRALLERALEDLLAHIEGAASGPDANIRSLVGEMFVIATERLAARPWIASLLVREVLSEGGSFREDFVTRFASPVASGVMAALEQARARGEIRQDIDPRLAHANLISLVMFPLIGRPVIERILGVSFEDASFRERLRRHGQDLFFEGIAERKVS